MGILDQLGLDPVKLAIQAFNFLLLLYLLNRFAYRPVVGMFDARASRIRTDLESAQAMRTEAEHDRTLRRDQLNKARDEARAIIEEANTVAARVHMERQGNLCRVASNPSNVRLDLKLLGIVERSRRGDFNAPDAACFVSKLVQPLHRVGE